MWFSVACFGVIVSVTFYLMCVHTLFSSGWATEMATFWERAAHSVEHMTICFLYILPICNFSYFLF